MSKSAIGIDNHSGCETEFTSRLEESQMKMSQAVAAFTGAMVLSAAVSHAALFYQKSTGGTTDWNVLGNYSSTTDGSGAAPLAMAGNDFNINGFTVGTPSTNNTFSGNSLTLGGGTLNLRNGNTKTISSLIGSGSSTIGANSTTTGFNVTTFSNPTGATTTLADTQGANAFLSIQSFTIGTLTGGGDLVLASNSGVNPGGRKTFLLTVTTGTGFTGNIAWSGANQPSLQFGNDAVFGGGLVATDAASRITLDRNVTFASVTLNGTSLSPGTYDYATLNSTYDTIFNNGGSGSITVVPEPTMIGLGVAMMLPLFARRRRA